MRTLTQASLFFGIILNLQGQVYNYYFGNLHSHTAFSDGNKDSASSGVSKPDGSYAYAKLSADFDFLGISEHNHYSTLRNPGFRRPLYAQGLAMADAANEEGKFLALFGMEYGVSSEYNGHLLIYGFNKLIGWETGVGGSTGDNFDIFNAKSDYASLFKKVNQQPGAFCYLAHPDFENYSTDGTWATALSNAPYNASFDSAIVGMPLRNGLATSASGNYTAYPQSDYFTYYKKILYQGYHLGIGFDHDNHYTNFGRGNGGRLVIMAPSLGRTNLYDAMKKMHFYGSDDPNARMKFELNGHMMGSVVTGSFYPTIEVTHNDPDGELADTLRIWKGYRNKPGLWADVIYQGLKTNTVIFNDLDLRSNFEYYYFAEVKQADGQWIVTSPIWYRPAEPVSMNEVGGYPFNLSVFPNPVNNLLYVSVDQCGPYDVTICDATGRVILQNVFNAREITINTILMQNGVYFLTIKSERGVITKKIIVE
jgi:hypothetical protein